MRKFLLSLFLLPILSLGAGVTGTYNVLGFDPNADQSYAGTVVITKQDKYYTGAWTYTDGTHETATGLEVGNELSFVFEGTEDPASDTGVQVYRIHCNGKKLKGPWILFNGTLVGTETLTKVD